MIATFARDVRYALRLLRRAPGFTAVATLTLALGIGGTTAIFSVVHGVLLKPLPYEDAGRLVVVQRSIPDGASAGSTTSPGNLYDWIERQRSFDTLAGWTGTIESKTAPGDAERLQGAVAIGALFEVLRVPAARGRTLTAGDDRPEAPPAIVISDDLWHRLFNGQPEALGRTITLGDRIYTIVGIMPPDFRFPDAPCSVSPADSRVSPWDPSVSGCSWRSSRLISRVSRRLRSTGR